jgi:hypothetical protein
MGRVDCLWCQSDALAARSSARSPAAIWAEMRVRRALLGYEPLYGVLVIAGVGLIALGFASEILHG